MKRIACMVLAAGNSSRFGERNKLVAHLEHAPVVRHVTLSAIHSRASRVIVVVASGATDIRLALSDLPVEWAENGAPTRGIASSLQVGLAAVGPDVDAVVVCLGDMPEVGAAHIDALIEAFLSSNGRNIFVPTYAGRRGNPVLWPASWFDALQNLEGDIGGRRLQELWPDAIHFVPLDDARGVLVDVDTEEDLKRLVDRRTRVAGSLATALEDPCD